jgi:POT family proton-dependent oligopeptide transporter
MNTHANADDRAFLGHPRALGYLAFAEAWERFSFYGMQALLVLYMVKQLLLPGHVEHVAGFGPFRAAIEGVYGPLSTQALASAIFGLYAGLVYLTPILGGALADRVLGRTATITLGAVLMAIGHFLMAFDLTFLPALACLVVGCGCFKGNLASQIGSLYGPGDLRRADAFQIYYLAINAGVILAPLVAGTLGEKVAWHYGFGVAGVGMLVALTGYLSARKRLPPDPPLRARDPAKRPKLRAGEGKAIAVLVCLIPVLAIAMVSNQQIFNAFLVWVEAHVDLQFAGYQMPTTWMITFDSVVSVSALVIVAGFWRIWGRWRREPDEVTKIAIGCFIAAAGMGCLAAGALLSGDHKVSVLWVLAFIVLNELGFANVAPVSLALYARAAPPAMASTIIGLFYLHLFAANNLTGWIGGFLDRMPAAQFWLMHAGMGLGAGLVFVVAKQLFGTVLTPRGEEPPLTEAAAILDARELPTT